MSFHALACTATHSSQGHQVSGEACRIIDSGLSVKMLDEDSTHLLVVSALGPVAHVRPGRLAPGVPGELVLVALVDASVPALIVTDKRVVDSVISGYQQQDMTLSREALTHHSEVVMLVLAGWSMTFSTRRLDCNTPHRIEVGEGGGGRGQCPPCVVVLRSSHCHMRRSCGPRRCRAGHGAVRRWR